MRGKGFLVSGFGRGSGPLKSGLAASFLLGGTGCFAALLYAAWGTGGAVYLSSFLVWWLALSCLGGGCIAGLRGGAGFWLRSASIGVAFACFFLLPLYAFAPGSLDLRDWVVYPGGAALLSSAGALGGANLKPARNKKRGTQVLPGSPGSRLLKRSGKGPG